MSELELCPCGLPLHYSDPGFETMMKEMVAELGQTVPVKAGGYWYRVPRHYIALHGVTSQTMPELARKYGWEVWT